MNENRKKELRKIAESAHKRVISEGLLDALESLDAGAIQSVKESIAKKLMVVLGIDMSSPVTPVFAGFVGNLELEDVRDMLIGNNECITASTALATGVSEALLEQVPQAMGVSESGIFADAVKEALASAAASKFNDAIGEAICDVDFSDALESVPGIGGVLAGFMPK